MYPACHRYHAMPFTPHKPTIIADNWQPFPHVPWRFSDCPAVNNYTYTCRLTGTKINEPKIIEQIQTYVKTHAFMTALIIDNDAEDTGIFCEAFRELFPQETCHTANACVKIKDMLNKSTPDIIIVDKYNLAARPLSGI